eukprot:4216169-Pyramimonas_sp.AAC.1
MFGSRPGRGKVGGPQQQRITGGAHVATTSTIRSTIGFASKAVLVISATHAMREGPVGPAAPAEPRRTSKGRSRR